MRQKFSPLAVLLFFTLSSCRQNQATALPVTMDDSARAIIDRAIAYAGGEEQWRQKKTLSFDKTSISYDSAGRVVRELRQHFDYRMQPGFRAKVTYMLHDTAITLLHDGQQARKLYNGVVSQEQKDIDGAWNACFGSQFVLCMPFKLKDPGIKAEYVGMVTLNDSTPAQVVKTSYREGAGSNPGHVWYYYFEPGTGRLLANSLNWEHNNWDFTRYESFEKAGGLLLPGVRTGYTATGLNQPGRKTAQSRHENIVFDKPFPDDYFSIRDGK